MMVRPHGKVVPTVHGNLPQHDLIEPWWCKVIYKQEPPLSIPKQQAPKDFKAWASNGRSAVVLVVTALGSTIVSD